MQNRNKIIDLFAANIATAVVHEILEEAIDDENLRKHYDKEFQNSFSIAKKYRENLNPIDRPLPIEDQDQIKDKIIAKVKNELSLRIKKGYNNVDLNKVESYTKKMLGKLKILQ